MTEIPLTKAQLQEKLAASPCIEFMKLEVLSADPEQGEVVMRAPLRPEFERVRGTGQWHGGPIASVIDTVGDYALVMLIGHGLPTINFRVDYLRPAVNTALIVKARIVRNGRSVGVVDVEVANEKGVVVAVGRACYATGAG
jgi:uncharacterized protein (TIGR00369 family)